MSLARGFWIAALTALLLAPSAAADAAKDLGDSARQAVGALPGSQRTPRIAEALASNAYLTALAFSAEARAGIWEQKAWERAQGRPSPPNAFLQEVLDAWHALRGEIDQTLASLRESPAARTTGEVDARLVVAHLLVEAEVNHDWAGSLLAGSAKPEYAQTSGQRYLFLRPLAVSETQLQAARHVLNGSEASRNTWDEPAFASRVSSLAAGASWGRPEAGPYHRLARHVVLQAALQKNVSASEWDSMLASLEARLNGHPPNLAWASVALHDGRWWQSQESGAPPQPLVDTLAGYAWGADYEAHLLGRDGERSVGISVGLIVGLGAAIVAVSIAAVVVGFRRRGRPRLSAALLVLTLLMAGLPGVQAEPLPAHPAETAVAFTQPETGAWGRLGLDSAGQAHLVWVACTRPAAGCYDVWHRTYDVERNAWSDAVRILDSSNNVSHPQLVFGGSAAHLFWIEALQAGAGDRALRWCPMAGSVCAAQPATLSAAGSNAYEAVVAVGADAHPRVAWQAEAAGESLLRTIRFTGSAWTAPASFPSGAGQRGPALDVDAQGTSHLAWSESPSDSTSSQTRRIMYGTVTLAGVATFEVLTSAGIEVATRPDLALQKNGTVGILFNNMRDTYFAERYPGQTLWTPLVNVSRSAGASRQSEVTLLSDGSDWVTHWRKGAYGSMELRRADRRGGVWLAPAGVVGAPFSDFMTLVGSSLDAKGRLHLSWTGTGPGASELQMHYRVVGYTPPPPPRILSASPGDEAWVRGPSVAVAVRFEASQTIDLGRSRLEVDGQPHPFGLELRRGEQILAADVPTASEGAHRLVAVVVDGAGGEARREWRVNIDSFAPRLVHALRADGTTVSAARAWHNASLAVEASAETEGGSRAWAELSVDDGLTYRPFLDAAFGALGFLADGSSWRLPEGSLFRLRIRAIDEAGNADAAPAMVVGWDATPPRASFSPKEWTSREALVLPFVVEPSQPAGSPVVLNASLRPLQGGDAMGWRRAEGVGTGALSFAPVSEGRYEISVRVLDEAGNGASPGPGPWLLGRDASAPSVVLVAREAGQVRFRVEDGVSGIDSVEVNGESVRARLGGPPIPSPFDLNVSVLPAEEVVLVVKDVAGFTTVATWTPGGTLQTRIEPPPGEPSLLDEGDPSLRGSPGSPRGGVPAPSMAVVLLLLALVCALRGRNEIDDGARRRH